MKLLNKILPSSKFIEDIQIKHNRLNAIEPISLKGIFLISPIKKKFLQIRKNNSIIEIKKSNKRLSLIVPYRHREEHLKVFIPYITDYLKKQQIEYEIVIVEQSDHKPFNRAKLMNIGAIHSSKDSDYFIFHDVDLLAENIDYRYCNHTKKLFNFIDNGDQTKEYEPHIFGGATLVPKEIFYDINGFSNNYWQWGKEDDDFLLRHIYKGHIPLYDRAGKFKALPHQKSITRDTSGNYVTDKKILKENKKLFNKNKKRFSRFKRGLLDQNLDGLSTIDNYTIKSIVENKKIKTISVIL